MLSTPLTANKLGLEGVGVMKSPDDSTDNEYVLEQGTLLVIILQYELSIVCCLLVSELN